MARCLTSSLFSSRYRTIKWLNQFDYQPSYRRNLPHIQPRGATFFVTFRLAGSLPQSVILDCQRERQWLTHLQETNHSHYRRVREEFERAWFTKFERILDRSVLGPVWLQDDRIAAIVAEALHYRHRRIYRLDAFTIMPNHVHAVIKPLHKVTSGDTYQALSSIMQSLKGYTSYKCNRLLGREGAFWAHESFDHWIRDANEWQRTVSYVLNNPVKARYVAHWQDWKWNYRRDTRSKPSVTSAN